MSRTLVNAPRQQARLAKAKPPLSQALGEPPAKQRRHAPPLPIFPPGGYGNQVALRVLQRSRPSVQAKLAVGPAGDAHEEEADRVADQVMRLATPDIAQGVPPQVSRKCAACAKEDDTVQRKEIGRAEPADGEAPASVRDALRGAGRPLDNATRAFFEPRFGHDFSAVRIHTGAQAERSAADLAAQAYTLGHDIVFEAGRYAPQTNEGRRLIAHELTHVVQQSSAPPLRPPERGRSGASHAAPSPPLGVAAAAVISRQPRAEPADAVMAVAPMDPVEAMRVLKAYLPAAFDESQAALSAVADTLRMPFTLENARTRLRLLIAAFSLLDRQDAALLRQTLTKPTNEKQKVLHDRFGRLDHRFRQPLLRMLSERAGDAKDAIAKTDERPDTAPPPSQVKWIKLAEGLFAYLAPAGVTIEQVANHISGDPALTDVLAAANNIPRGTRLSMQRQIVVPVEYISRIGAKRELPEDLAREIAEAQQLKGEQAAFKRFAVAHGGHPAGPGAVGLIPLTAGLITAVIAKAKYFAGFIVGLLEGAWDAVKDLFTGVVTVIKTVAQVLYDLLTLNFGKIWDMVKGWIEQLELLWAHRAEIASEILDKWNAKDDWDRGKFRGEVIGWVIVTVLITVLTWGEGAIEQITGKWAKVVQLLKLAQKAGDFSIYVKAFLGTAGKIAREAIAALKASRLGKVVTVAEVAAQPLVWTAKAVKAALKLPRKMADELTDALAERLQALAPYADRIKNLSIRAKRWLFGCRSPCDWNVKRALETLGNDDQRIEARAAEALGEEVWTIEELGVPSDELPVIVESRARGFAIEDFHMRQLENEGYKPLPDWFKTHDAYRGGIESFETVGGKRIRVIRRPDAISIKSTKITDPAGLTEKVNADLEKLRGGFEHTRGGVRIEGVRRRQLDLVFEEGSPIKPDTVRTLRQLQRTAGSIKIEWYVMRSGRKYSGVEYLRDVAAAIR